VNTPARSGDDAAADAAEAALHEARIAELATGFALGELDEPELRELHEALKNEGAATARVAWEALATVVDLRAGMSHQFADELAHRLKKQAKSDRFETGLWRRMGFSRPGLAPVSAPEATGRRQIPLRLIAAAVLAAVVVTALLTLGVFERAAVARVAELAGSAQLEGRALTVGAGVDRRLVAVPAGSRLTLAWDDGTRATLIGPAQSLAQNRGLSLATGRAVIDVGPQAFALGLPDRGRAVELAASSRALIELRSGRSLIALEHGAAAHDGGTLVAGRALGDGSDYAWIDQRPAGGTAGAIGEGIDAPTWRFAATLAPADAGGLALTLTQRDGTGATLRIADGAATVLSGDEAVQRMALRGPPLAPLAVALTRDHGVLRAQVGGYELRLPALAAPITLAWTGENGTRLGEVTFHTGPLPR